MKKIIYFAALLAMPAMAQQTNVATLEDTNVAFNEQNYWNGGMIGEPEEGDWGEDVYHCPWQSALVSGVVNFCDMYGYTWWGGIALSQSTSTEFVVLDDQYNNIVGGGANGSQTFGVIYGDDSKLDINVDGGALVNSIYVCNSAYTHNNFTKTTGSYDTEFTADGDHFYLDIVGTCADGTEKTVVVKMAEYADEELTYLEGWTRVDLSSLGNDVVSLTFNFDCNKPMVATYACIDNIEIITGTEGMADFENLQLADESFWNGTDETGSFVSGGFLFENGYQDYGGYPYCYGFFYTNRTATTYTGDAVQEQYNSAVGHGAEDSKTYATYNLNLFDNPKGVVVLGEPRIISGCYLTNNAYAYLSMKNGENYTKQFGQGDWFKLTITGKDANGEATGSVDFYLADLRSDNEADHFILDEWRWCDLTSLGAVSRLDFNMSSTDNGDWGMNTPAYFCMDNLGGEQPVTTGMSRNSINLCQDQDVYDLQGRRISAAERSTFNAQRLIIVRQADGTVRKVLVK